jgi:hypothetical protein|tara:strand:- start:353 stop:1645 length:1293 start_codon:yes stop_codon:yes gene_type:complete
MTVNKGLKSLVESSPNFSNQALENAINEIKAVDKDDGYLFIKSQFDVDTAIHNNTVLTTSQKNDALETLYAAQPHLQIGRYLNDLIRHTNIILDGSIIPGNPDVVTGEDGQGTFSEILLLVQGLQSTITEQFGVTPAEKGRDVNDHLGILNNIFLETEDSSAPVFTRLTRILTLIRDTATAGGGSSALAIGTAAVRYSNSQLVTFLATLVADSTDFQTSLDNAVNQAAGNMASLNTRISDALAGDPIGELTTIRDSIVTQQTLENSNITSLRTYTSTLADNSAYIGLADDPTLRSLMAKVAQDSNWKNYFETYEDTQADLNPIYTTDTDSDKSAVIDRVLADSGLPDVTDATDFEAVANKAKRDSRIDTANFDRITVEQQIIRSCEQLGITTANRTIGSLSGTLLRNMNQHDRDEIARALDLNESASTLS